MQSDIEQKTRRARLKVGSPEYVYAELKEYGALVRAQPWSVADDYMELQIAERNEPLIDIGLASYATSRNIVADLYQKGKEAEDGVHGFALRLAALSNEVVNSRGILTRFPMDVIGEEEVTDILQNGHWDLARALITNPSVSDDLLLAVYRGEKLAANLSDDRRRELVGLSGHNPRIFTNEDNDYGPDMGHWSIHEAIFNMVETVPTSDHWLWNLTHLLKMLDPQQVRRPDNIDTALERWRFDENGNEADLSKEDEYNSTGLSDRAEFRCLVAALYGKSFGKKQVTIQGKATDEDVARRCAFYGNGSLTEKDIDEGRERDGPVFNFAAMFNDEVFLRKNLRRKFEEDCLNGGWTTSYRSRCEQIKRRWPHFDTRPTAEWMIDPEPPSEDPMIRKVEQLSADMKRLVELSKWLPWVIVAIAGIMIIRG